MSAIVAHSQAQSLFHTAQFYALWGWSCIPIWGDAQPERAKLAALNWRDFQHRHPSQGELADWFLHRGYGGLAIVTGRVSQLIVLDFDDERLESAFKRRYPHLTQTRVVQSAGRALSHYYFSLPPWLATPSRRVKGLDLQSSGRYIIAPPTQLAGKAYRLIAGTKPKLLDEHDLQCIQRFMDACAPSAEPLELLKPIDDQRSPTDDLNRLTPTSLISLYQHLAPQRGRNEALFRTALVARDDGWTQVQTEALLSEVHARQAPPASHATESLQARRREAGATLASVYRRPRRPLKPAYALLGLPTSIREALLRLKATAVARVLDALLQSGVACGMALTEREILAKVGLSIGRFSVLKSLHTSFSDASPIFELWSDPSPKPPTHTDVAIGCEQAQNKKCSLFGASESDKNPAAGRGRPPKRYIVPTLARLCQALGVPYTSADPLSREDLKSARRYRMAIEREFIRRRPASYNRQWLAGRLGISRRTSQRYHASVGICRKPSYQASALSAHDLERLPLDASERLPHSCLMDEQGRRYPAVRPIAQRLLKRRSVILLLRQMENHYWMPSTPTPALDLYEWWEKPVETPQKGIESNLAYEQVKSYTEALKIAQNELKRNSLALRRQVLAGLPSAGQTGLLAPAPHLGQAKTAPDLRQQEALWHTEKTPARPFKAKPKRYYRQALASVRLEWLAKKLQTTLQQRAQALKALQGSLSLPNARRWVDEYGIRLVRRLLHILEKRHDVTNPAGFALTWLRDTARREAHRASLAWG